MFEEATELRKSKPMLLAAAFKSNWQTYIELLLFIMVSMTYLNAMEDMRIFEALKAWLVGKLLTDRQLFWITGFLVFFISSVVKGLTAGLLMGAVAVWQEQSAFRHAGLVVTRRQLLQEVWGIEHIHDQHYLRIYMDQLRHKLEINPARPRYLLTEVGVGYCLSVDETEFPNSPFDHESRFLRLFYIPAANFYNFFIRSSVQ